MVRNFEDVPLCDCMHAARERGTLRVCRCEYVLLSDIDWRAHECHQKQSPDVCWSCRTEGGGGGIGV